MTTATFTGLPEEIQVFQDNDLTLNVTALDESGAAFDISNYVGVFTMKALKTDRDSLILLQKETDKATEGSIVSAPAGTMQFLILRTDTAALKPGTYTWDISIFDSTNDLKYTISSGSARVMQAVMHGTPAPTFTSSTPDTGLEAGGTSITIAGTGFQVGVAVTIGGSAVTTLVRTSAIQLTCDTPAGTGAADIVITNPDAQLVTSTGGFTYT